MSRQIGLDAINLRPTPRLAHTEYNDHWPLIREVTGLPHGHPDQAREMARLWEYDYIWSTHNGPVPWEARGRTTDMGHAEFMEGGVDRREPKPCPFTDVEEVLSFDAVAEYGLTDYRTLVDFYQGVYDRQQAYYSDALCGGGYYRTLVSGAIAAFGWDMLLEAAAYRDRFTKVLDSIFQQSLHHYTAWADTTIPVFMCHDDMVWSQGAFMRPDYYRAEIFPRFKALWSVLKKKGKKLLFTSDGDFTAFVDDVVEAGAEALCFEPMTNLEAVVAKYGSSICIMSSQVDCRTMAFGTKDDIRAEIDASLEQARKCKGFMFAVGNHIPANVPMENVRFYMDYLRAHWGR